jgi:hypothetical protein
MNKIQNPVLLHNHNKYKCLLTNKEKLKNHNIFIGKYTNSLLKNEIELNKDEVLKDDIKYEYYICEISPISFDDIILFIVQKKPELFTNLYENKNLISRYLSENNSHRDKTLQRQIDKNIIKKFKKENFFGKSVTDISERKNRIACGSYNCIYKIKNSDETNYKCIKISKKQNGDDLKDGLFHSILYNYIEFIKNKDEYNYITPISQFVLNKVSNNYITDMNCMEGDCTNLFKIHNNLLERKKIILNIIKFFCKKLIFLVEKIKFNHNDLKLDNIFYKKIGLSYYLYLADFGFSKLVLDKDYIISKNPIFSNHSPYFNKYKKHDSDILYFILFLYLYYKNKSSIYSEVLVYIINLINKKFSKRLSIAQLNVIYNKNKKSGYGNNNYYDLYNEIYNTYEDNLTFKNLLDLCEEELKIEEFESIEFNFIH